MTIDDHGGREPLQIDPGRIVGEPQHEPALRAPWPAVALALSFLALYALQLATGDPQRILARFGFTPADLSAGRWTGLITALFVHGGWAHAFLNALGALAFGAPVARLFGRGAVGVLAFFGFFLLCGVASSLGYAALHWGAPYVLVGASGGVSGFMGAASRLIERRGAGLAPFSSRTVTGMALAWVVVNIVVGVVGLGGVGGGAPIAWEAHVVGYAVGLALIGPAARGLRRI
ncbi:MAG TPA: rhomboid family intramembrane serine protease [Caulobacteraceae bacterium]|jgi:membrane associated rhomboid family serine protease|nr:rhomboid family intramembrane serine protease [Caulobacteraceae bacterium]